MRFVLVPIVAVIVLVGIWVTGGLITDDFRVAMLLTALWFAFAGAVSLAIGWRRRRLALPVFGTYVMTALWFAFTGVVSLAIGWRRRRLALPVLGTYLLTALAVGGYLAYASMVDKVVDERVAVAAVNPAQTGTNVDTSAAPRNVALARGTFASGEHETNGKATVIRLAEGGRVLTLTGFGTSPGPDLRVYLVSGSMDELGDVVDLGGLKGNKGDQQYDVPSALDLRSHRTVVIWCRAFSVPFGSAELT